MATKQSPSPGLRTFDHSVASMALTSLPDRARRYAHARTAIAVLVSAGAAIVMAAFVEGTPRTVLLAIVVPAIATIGIADAIIFNPLQHRWTGYSVEQEAVVLATGRVLRAVTTIDGSKVLAVDIVQGPLLRSMGLALVRFRCLADMPSLGPVSLAEAERVRHLLIDITDVPKNADAAH